MLNVLCKNFRKFNSDAVTDGEMMLAISVGVKELLRLQTSDLNAPRKVMIVNLRMNPRILRKRMAQALQLMQVYVINQM